MAVLARYRFEPIAVRIGQTCRFCRAVSVGRLAAVLLTLQADAPAGVSAPISAIPMHGGSVPGSRGEARLS